jgi:hypothetical protein
MMARVGDHKSPEDSLNVSAVRVLRARHRNLPAEIELYPHMKQNPWTIITPISQVFLANGCHSFYAIHARHEVVHKHLSRQKETFFIH